MRSLNWSLLKSVRFVSETFISCRLGNSIAEGSAFICLLKEVIQVSGEPLLYMDPVRLRGQKGHKSCLAGSQNSILLNVA